jgi:cytochrome c556
MRIVTLLSAAGLAAVLYAGFASAQQNPIEERRNMMKTNGRHSALISKMVKGEEAYDAAKVKQAFDDWEATAKKYGSLFPENSKDGDTRALPAVWTNKAEFDKLLAKFGQDVAAEKSKATANLDGLKQAMAVVGPDCGGCHKEFRKPQ